MLGVAISTCNRRDNAIWTVKAWRDRMPANSVLIVVDDASDGPFPEIGGVKVIRHPRRMGVAATKNSCLEALMNAGCTDMLLADDDVHPVTGDWWQPYVDSPLEHLVFGWPHRKRPRPDATGWPPRIVKEDSQHTWYSFPRGVLMYIHRNAVERVGGMNTAHGKFSGEHVEWSHRVLGGAPYPDITGSENLFWSRDKEVGNTKGSSFDLAERRILHKANGKQFDRRWEGWPYMPYRRGERFQDWDLAAKFEAPGDHYALLRHCAQIATPGTATEFGTGSGESAKILAHHMPVVTFGSVSGLPEDWRDDSDGTFRKGDFAYPLPHIDGVRVVEGLFSNTLPGFDFEGLGTISLAHFDADLKSSTLEALNAVGPYLHAGSILVFDEWHGYESASEHEQAAFREWVGDRSWVAIGHGHQAWALRLL